MTGPTGLMRPVQALKDRIAELEGEIGAANDAADAMGSLHARINYHSGEVSRLEMEIGDPSDTANAMGSLHAQLNHANDVASGLRMTIGMPDDAADMDGSLHAQIAYHMGEATRLSMEAGESTDPADEMGSLHAQINYHSGEVSRLEMEIGDPSDTANDMGSLHAQLNHANGVANGLRMTIGMPDDAPNSSPTASLHAQLNSAKAMIGMSSDTAMPDADGNFAPGTSLYAMLNFYKGEYERRKQEEEDAAKATNNARAKSVLTALTAHKVGADAADSPLDGSNVTGAYTNYDITAERSADGGMVTVTVDEDDQNAATVEDMYKATGASGDPWSSVLVERTTEDEDGDPTGVEEWMVVTDIAVPTPTPIATEFTTGQIYVALTASTDSLSTRRIMLDEVPAGTNRTINYEQNAVLQGSYKAVEGEFTCTAAGGCALSFNADENLVITGDMQFEPDNVAATYPTQDAAYLYFGWCAKEAE